MIEIKKGPEPVELLQYRFTKNATYEGMPSDIKDKVKESLMREQGYLCAYCMCRIEMGTGKHRATIEHCLPQTLTTESERLNYRNMVAVCWGNRDAHSNEEKTCDAKRGSLPVEQQEMKKVELFRGDSLREIQYASDGRIFSENKDLDEDLNLRLNLNCEARQLKDCRKSALDTLRRKVAKDYPNKTAPKEYFQNLLRCYMESSTEKTPYCGVLIAWLQKRT
jgi:uncharacterized protein (TIGR02646 family)